MSASLNLVFIASSSPGEEGGRAVRRFIAVLLAMRERVLDVLSPLSSLACAASASIDALQKAVAYRAVSGTSTWKALI
ncbi:hypothetical protein [Pandoraea bronchicola]|uniref:hypothetical protein n=1 Tax=Pandoraea bronchicola TaxID=2508287 RepID=UPI001241C82A|nr:hypothetical protein [Pandoraea bronchicola]